jgi:hypothetical protein
MLQNLDLDSVTFAQVQSTGDPISIEDMNEQEMLDLIIVNLARLCVKQEWDGLLSAGGVAQEMLGGSPNGDWQSGYNDYQSIACSHGRSAQALTNLELTGGRQFFWPFTSSMTGDLTEIGCQVKIAVAAQNVRVGIYNADADSGNPTDLIGYADFDASSTGEKYETSLSATINLTRGSLYWYAVVQTTTGGTVQIEGMNTTYAGSSYLAQNTIPASWTMVNYTNVNVLSDPAATSNMRGGNASYPPAMVVVKWI